MSWYRTYRPQTIGSLHLLSLREAMERVRLSGAFSHAYLLTGPKGTGKTSSARILAKLFNCEKNAEHVRSFLSGKQQEKRAFQEPCNTCPSCIAITQGKSFCVVEMDAASHRGIDDIRALRERIYLAPTDGLISVYIIDEVHMLTTEAFNALLKVLEEPPAHVVFVLATTEMHKVPETIVSRCTLLQSQKAKAEEIVPALRAIVQAEHVDADDATLLAIATHADGSFRDAVKFLEQVGSGKSRLTAEEVHIGLHDMTVEPLIDALVSKQVKDVSRLFTEYAQQGIDLRDLQTRVLERLHTRLLEHIEQGRSTAFFMALLQRCNVPLSPFLPDPSLPFELACMEWCLGEPGEEGSEKIRETHEQPTQPTRTGTQDSVVYEIKHKESVQSMSTGEKTVPEKHLPHSSPVEHAQESTDQHVHSSIKLDGLLEKWETILKETKKQNATVEALLRAARPKEVVGDVVTIEVFYTFHKEQLEHEKYRVLLEKVIALVCAAKSARLHFVLGKKPLKEERQVVQQQQDEQLAKSAEEVFGV